MNTTHFPSLPFPACAVGTMSLGPDEAKATFLLDKVLDAGIRMIDVADLYDGGRTEEIVGKALIGKRHKVQLISKGGNQMHANQRTWSWNPDPVYLEQALEASLRRLQTDYLDLYLLHGGTLQDPIDDIIELFERKKEAGLIRGFGISSIRPQVIKYWAEHSSVSAVMCQYSVLDRRPEEQIFPLLERHGIPVLVRGALAKGLLCAKPATAYLGRSAQETNQIVSSFRQLSCNTGSDHAAMSFAHSPEVVSTIVVGISAMEQIERLMNWQPGQDPPWLKSLKKEIPVNTYHQHRV